MVQVRIPVVSYFIIPKYLYIFSSKTRTILDLGMNVQAMGQMPRNPQKTSFMYFKRCCILYMNTWHNFSKAKTAFVTIYYYPLRADIDITFIWKYIPYQNMFRMYFWTDVLKWVICHKRVLITLLYIAVYFAS